MALTAPNTKAHPSIAKAAVPVASSRCWAVPCFQHAAPRFNRVPSAPDHKAGYRANGIGVTDDTARTFCGVPSRSTGLSQEELAFAQD
jgi:hypothetical protein